MSIDITEDQWRAGCELFMSWAEHMQSGKLMDIAWAAKHAPGAIFHAMLAAGGGREATTATSRKKVNPGEAICWESWRTPTDLVAAVLKVQETAASMGIAPDQYELETNVQHLNFSEGQVVARGKA